MTPTNQSLREPPPPRRVGRRAEREALPPRECPLPTSHHVVYPLQGQLLPYTRRAVSKLSLTDLTNSPLRSSSVLSEYGPFYSVPKGLIPREARPARETLSSTPPPPRPPQCSTTSFLCSFSHSPGRTRRWWRAAGVRSPASPVPARPPSSPTPQPVPASSALRLSPLSQPSLSPLSLSPLPPRSLPTCRAVAAPPAHATPHSATAPHAPSAT